MNRIKLKDYTKVYHEGILEDLDKEICDYLYDALNIQNEQNKEQLLTDELCYRLQKRFQKQENILIANENRTKEDTLTIFSLLNNEWWTQQYVGVVECPIKEIFKNELSPEILEKTGDTRLTIQIDSRFDAEENPRFLMFVFEKAFNLNSNIFEKMNISGKSEKTWDLFLVVLFLRQMHDAMRKGMFRQYQEFEYNDSKVRGRIDISRHIKENMLFNGKIAYTTREYTVDNDINRLIMMAYNYIEKTYPGLLRNMTARDDIVKKGVNTLRAEIENLWETSPREILKKTRKKIVHSVYKNYEPLRKTSIAILKKYGVNVFTEDNNAASGILVNMAGLWEIYLYNVIFKELTDQKDDYNQKSFEIINKHRTVKPDFLWEEKKMVFDAKYKVFWGETLGENGNWSEKTRADINQVFAYTLIFNCDCGGIVFPVKSSSFETATSLKNVKDFIEQDKNKIAETTCANKFFIRIPYCIPKVDGNEGDTAFRTKMETQSEEIKAVLREMKLSD